MHGIIGKKEGQTRCFNSDGSACAVTLVSISPNFITQLKTMETDGYSAIQVAVGSNKNLTKPLVGHLKKAKVASSRLIKEFRVDSTENYQLGEPTATDWLSKIKSVDVIGTNKGKGFAGVVKRHNFKTQDASHGNSLAHRAPGSIGHCQDPGKVFKGKKMAGRMGGKRVTQKNVSIIEFNAEKGVLVLKGSIPGAPGQFVIINPSLKTKGVKDEG